MAGRNYSELIQRAINVLESAIQRSKDAEVKDDEEKVKKTINLQKALNDLKAIKLPDFKELSDFDKILEKYPECRFRWCDSTGDDKKSCCIFK